MARALNRRKGHVKIAIASLVLACAVPAFAEKLDVKIIDRQDHDTDYSYVVPAHLYANSNANVNCSGDGNNVNCNGSSNTYATAEHFAGPRGNHRSCREPIAVEKCFEAACWRRATAGVTYLLAVVLVCRPFASANIFSA
jgi:hypothetical protein